MTGKLRGGKELPRLAQKRINSDTIIGQLWKETSCHMKMVILAGGGDPVLERKMGVECQSFMS